MGYRMTHCGVTAAAAHEAILVQRPDGPKLSSSCLTLKKSLMLFWVCVLVCLARPGLQDCGFGVAWFAGRRCSARLQLWLQLLARGVAAAFGQRCA